ncbi:hypothetical protein SAMN05421636_1254 [Pricia antarctica]|uniref:Uncharacterized protein n=1 Tax=Pricia antarctica TaxID=641691 RepID=A0A1G7JF93_9FLAO|nr:hypothetical protein [Pricia antarctica]SDF23553.1 hypothetical protein SAMN05421636_1254 [Pricia antarctica]
MTNYHLDRHFSKLSNDEVFIIIEYLTSPFSDRLDLTALDQLLCLADLIGHIKTKKVLVNTINHLIWIGWFKDISQIKNILFEVGSLNMYNKSDAIKIKGLAYSALFKYELACGQISTNNATEVNNLVINLKGRVLTHNGDELLTKSTLAFLEGKTESFTPNHRVKMLNKLVDYYSQKECATDDKIASRTRRYFHNLKQTFSQNSSSKTHYPLINKKTLKIFKKYLKRHIIEDYVDHSYLFQRLLHEKLLVPTKQQMYMKWLLEYGHIKQPQYDLLIEKGFFRSLAKSTSHQRENNFNLLFDEILPNIIDFR